MALIECRSCGGEISENAKSCPHCGEPYKGIQDYQKKKGLAAALAILFGIVGAHKFYLGQIIWGLIYLAFSFTFIPFFVGIVEGIIYLQTKDEDFQAKYPPSQKS